MQIPSRWIDLLVKPAVVAGIIGCFSFFGLADQIAGFSANLGEKDRIVRWSAVLSGATRDAIPVTLVDVDAAAMAALGHPPRVPRDLLSGLVGLAAEKQAAGIYLDMDTSQPGTPAGDQALIAALARYPAAAPPVVLARRLNAAAPAEGGVESLVEEPSILDEAVRGRENILWAASLSRIDEDRVVRRWELSQTFCTPQGGHTLPSPQLVAAAVAGQPPRPLDDVRRFAEARTQAVCDQVASTVPWPRNPHQRAAIPFLIADGPDWVHAQFIQRHGLSVPLFRRVSARALMSASGALLAPRKVAADLFRDRFVIIGASHADSQDGHLTPIGYLPGAVIVANAVAMAPAILAGQPLGPAGATLMALVLFALLWAITARLRALAATVVVAVAVLGALLVLGRFLAPSTAGDIVLAAFGMLAFFSTLQGVYTVGREWRERGWRVLLKPGKARPASRPQDAA